MVTSSSEEEVDQTKQKVIETQSVPETQAPGVHQSQVDLSLWQTSINQTVSILNPSLENILKRLDDLTKPKSTKTKRSKSSSDSAEKPILIKCAKIIPSYAASNPDTDQATLSLSLPTLSLSLPNDWSMPSPPNITIPRKPESEASETSNITHDFMFSSSEEGSDQEEEIDIGRAKGTLFAKPQNSSPYLKTSRGI